MEHHHYEWTSSTLQDHVGGLSSFTYLSDSLFPILHSVLQHHPCRLPSHSSHLACHVCRFIAVFHFTTLSPINPSSLHTSNWPIPNFSNHRFQVPTKCIGDIIIIIYLLRQMAAHIKYTNQYTKNTIHSIKENYKLGLQFIRCYEKIAVFTKCRHKLRFSSATPKHKLWMEYFDNILPYSCVHIAEKDRITLLSHVRMFFINSNFRWSIIYDIGKTLQ